MSTLSGPCPATWEISRLASGEEADAAVQEHVCQCASCRARLEAAREETQFLARMKELVASEIGPAGAPVLPGYRSIEVLSSGSQGVVYRAVQEATSRPVAIKVLAAGHAATSRQRARAEREAEIAARLRHPNIVTVYESRTTKDGRVVVVMEFVDGVALDDWKPPGATRDERQRSLLRAFATVCGAIHHAHLNGVIHRDLKPDNILVTHEGRPVVLDFGIAKSGGSLHTTITGEFAGTPAYASPEQVALKPDSVDALTDVYSLGVILYQLLTGMMPYEVGESIFEVARAIGETEPIPPRRRDPTLSPDLEAIVLKALRKDKVRRYQSAAGLARDVERYLAGEPVEARSGSGWYLLRKAVVVNRGRLAIASVGLVVLAVAGIAVLLSLTRARDLAVIAAQSRDLARAEGVRARAVAELLREALPTNDPARPDIANTIGTGLYRLHFRLETGSFEDDPELDQALRRIWASVYTEFGNGKAAGVVEFAEVSLRNGLVKTRQLHGAEHPEVAASLHDLAGVVLMRKRALEAQHLCEQALGMRERLLGPSSSAAAESRALLARILLERGELPNAEAQADRALSILRAQPEREVDLLLARMTGIKARAAIVRKDAAAAEELVRETLRRRLRRLPPEDPELIAVLNDAADLIAESPACALASDLSRAWGIEQSAIAATLRQDAKALAVIDRIDTNDIVKTGRTSAAARLLSMAEMFLDPMDPALVRILFTQMRAGAIEGRIAEKIVAAKRAAEILAHHYGENDRTVLLCVEEAAAVSAAGGHIADAVELARWSVRVNESVAPEARDELTMGNARRYLGWYLVLAGRFEEATPVLRQTVRELVDAVGEQHHVVALAESHLAVALSHSGVQAEIDEAELLSAKATALSSLPASAGDQRAHISFARARVLIARADRATGADRIALLREARDTLDRVWEIQYRFVWWLRLPWRRELLQSQLMICTEIGDDAALQRWTERFNEDEHLAEQENLPAGLPSQR